MTWTEDTYTDYVNSNYSNYTQRDWDEITNLWTDRDMMNYHEFLEGFSYGPSVWKSDYTTTVGGRLISEIGQLGIQENETLGDNSGTEGDFSGE